MKKRKPSFRRARDLTLPEARRFVRLLHESFYFETLNGRPHWNPEIPVNGADLVSFCGRLFEDLGMVPPDKEERE